jgi:hypothetical protein
MTLATEHAEGDGFRVIVAAPREAGRLVAAVRRYYGEIGYQIGPVQAEAIHILCSNPSLGRAWLLSGGRHDVGHALAY